MNIEFNTTTLTIELNELEARNLAYQLSYSVDQLRQDRALALRPFSYDSDDYQRLNDDYNYHIENNIRIREAVREFIEENYEE